MGNFKYENKSETILIGIAIFMFAVIIGYNAFFTPEIPPIIKTSGNTVSSAGLAPEDNPPESDSENFLININSATAEELSDNLNGVGEVIAKRIIEYRETHGGFSSIEEIMNVKGIGEKFFAKIKDYITV